MIRVPESKTKAPLVTANPPKFNVPPPIVRLALVAPKVPDPLKVNVPEVTMVDPAYVLFPARVISPVPTLVRAMLAAPLISEPIVILPVPPMEFPLEPVRVKVDPVTLAAVVLLLPKNPKAASEPVPPPVIASPVIE